MNASMFGHGIEVAEGYFILLEPSIRGHDASWDAFKDLNKLPQLFQNYFKRWFYSYFIISINVGILQDYVVLQFYMNELIAKLL